MKIIITEAQFNNIVNEQFISSLGLSVAGVESQKYVAANPHAALTITGIAASFIPIVGPFLSAGIGLADAALYVSEGDKKMAGMTAMFSLLPFAGPLLNKIPGLKEAVSKLGQKGLALLGSKIIKGGKNLTPLEKQVAEGIAANPKLVLSELDVVVKNTASKALNSGNIPSQTKNLLASFAKGGLKLAGVGATYGTAYVMYDQIYDTLVKKGPMGLTQEQYNYIVNIETENISTENKQAAASIKFD